jgi:hypothetical protein
LIINPWITEASGDAGGHFHQIQVLVLEELTGKK